MDGRPVDPESAWSGYAGATRADPPPGAVKRSLQIRGESDDLEGDGFEDRACAVAGA